MYIVHWAEIYVMTPYWVITYDNSDRAQSESRSEYDDGVNGQVIVGLLYCTNYWIIGFIMLTFKSWNCGNSYWFHGIFAWWTAPCLFVTSIFLSKVFLTKGVLFQMVVYILYIKMVALERSTTDRVIIQTALFLSFKYLSNGTKYMLVWLILSPQSIFYKTYIRV